MSTRDNRDTHTIMRNTMVSKKPHIAPSKHQHRIEMARRNRRMQRDDWEMWGGQMLAVFNLCLWGYIINGLLTGWKS